MLILIPELCMNIACLGERALHLEHKEEAGMNLALVSVNVWNSEIAHKMYSLFDHCPMLPLCSALPGGDAANACDLNSFFKEYAMERDLSHGCNEKIRIKPACNERFTPSFAPFSPSLYFPHPRNTPACERRYGGISRAGKYRPAFFSC